MCDSRCTICFTEIEEEERVREIGACGHIFHTNCLDKWLKIKEVCPLCKAELSRYDLDEERFGQRPTEEEEEIEGEIELIEQIENEFYEGEQGLNRNEVQRFINVDFGNGVDLNETRVEDDREMLNIVNLERNMRSMSDRISQLSRQIEHLSGEVNSREIFLSQFSDNGTIRREEIDALNNRLQERTEEINNLLSFDTNLGQN